MKNRIRRPFTLFLAALLGFISFGRSSAGPLPMIPGDSGKPTLAPMIEKVLPAVANISTTSKVRMEQNPLFNDPFFRRFFEIPEMPAEREQQSLGSGVIVDADKGLIITNNHVVEHATQITVTLRDGRHFDAKAVGSDPETDIALIRIKADRLSALPFGNSDTLRVGDFVVAIGSPFGLSQTVTSGIVSALGRSGLGIEGYENFIQTDASINPGNSGGALVDLDGNLVGINTAIVGPTGGNVGIGFAIPSNMARDVVTQLTQFGEIKRGQLGVMVQDLTPELAKALHIERTGGALISQVKPNTPAAKSGLRAGDVVVAVDGAAVANAGSLRNAIGMLRIGSEVKLDILRDGKPMSLSAVIAKPKQEKRKAAQRSSRLAGAEFGTLEPGHPLAGEVEGIEVIGVEKGSPAWSAGLRKGDVIVSVNRQAVKDIDEFERMTEQSTGPLLLNVRRDDSALFIAIE